MISSLFKVCDEVCYLCKNIYMYIFCFLLSSDEAIDQESFLLLDEATIAALVPRVGLRLKFQKKFREFVVSTENGLCLF